MNAGKILKVGVVGAGHLGKYHIEKLKLMNQVDLVGFYDEDLYRAKHISELYDISAYSSMGELFDCCEAISIVTPTSTHFEVAQRAMNSGCHVFIEKPITDSVHSAEQLIKISNQKKLNIQVGHIERFNPAFCSLDVDDINPHFIESHRISQFPNRGTDVDVILDLMIHDIDILLFLIKSKVRAISASGLCVLSKTYDLVNTRIEFENGSIANLTASRISQKNMRRFRIYDKNKYISIDFLKRKAERFSISKANKKKKNILLNETLHVEEYDALERELNSFVNSVINSKKPLVDGRCGLNAIKLAAEIKGSIKTE